MSTENQGIGALSDKARTMNTEPSFLENERQLVADFARGVYDVGRAGFSGLTHQVVAGYGGLIESYIQQGDYDKAQELIDLIQQEAYLPEEGTAGAEALETIGKVFEPVQKYLIEKPGDFLAENVSQGAGAAYQGGMTSFLEFLPFHLRSRAGPGIGQVTPAAFLERPASRSGPTTAMGGPEIGQFVEPRPSDTVPVRPEDIQYQTIADNIEAQRENLPVVTERGVDPTVTERVGTAAPALTSAPEEVSAATFTPEEIPAATFTPEEKLPSEELRAMSLSDQPKPKSMSAGRGLSFRRLEKLRQDYQALLVDNPDNKNLSKYELREVPKTAAPGIATDSKKTPFSEEMFKFMTGEKTTFSSNFMKGVEDFTERRLNDDERATRLEFFPKDNSIEVFVSDVDKLEKVRDDANKIFDLYGEQIEGKPSFQAAEKLELRAPLETTLLDIKRQLSSKNNVVQENDIYSPLELPTAQVFLENLTGNRAGDRKKLNKDALKRVPDVEKLLSDNPDRIVADFETLRDKGVSEEDLAKNYIDIDTLRQTAQLGTKKIQVRHLNPQNYFGGLQIPVSTKAGFPRVRSVIIDTPFTETGYISAHKYGDHGDTAKFDEQGRFLGHGVIAGHIRSQDHPADEFYGFADVPLSRRLSELATDKVVSFTEAQTDVLRGLDNPYFQPIKNPEALVKQHENVSESLEYNQKEFLNNLPAAKLIDKINDDETRFSTLVEYALALSNKGVPTNSNHFYNQAHYHFDKDILDLAVDVKDLKALKGVRDLNPENYFGGTQTPVSTREKPNKKAVSNKEKRVKESKKAFKNRYNVSFDELINQSVLPSTKPSIEKVFLNRDDYKKLENAGELSAERITGKRLVPYTLSPNQIESYIKADYLRTGGFASRFERQKPKSKTGGRAQNDLIKLISGQVINYDQFLQDLRDLNSGNRTEQEDFGKIKQNLTEFLNLSMGLPETKTGLNFNSLYNFEDLKLSPNVHENSLLYGRAFGSPYEGSSVPYNAKLFESWLKQKTIGSSLSETDLAELQKKYGAISFFKNPEHEFSFNLAAQKYKNLFGLDLFNPIEGPGLDLLNSAKAKREEIKNTSKRKTTLENYSKTYPDSPVLLNTVAKNVDKIEKISKDLDDELSSTLMWPKIIAENPDVFVTDAQHRVNFENVASQGSSTSMEELIELDSTLPLSLVSNLPDLKENLKKILSQLKSNLKKIKTSGVTTGYFDTGRTYDIYETYSLYDQLYRNEDIPGKLRLTDRNAFKALPNVKDFNNEGAFYDLALNYFIMENVQRPEVQGVFFPDWKQQVVAHWNGFPADKKYLFIRPTDLKIGENPSNKKTFNKVYVTEDQVVDGEKTTLGFYDVVIDDKGVFIPEKSGFKPLRTGEYQGRQEFVNLDPGPLSVFIEQLKKDLRDIKAGDKARVEDRQQNVDTAYDSNDIKRPIILLKRKGSKDNYYYEPVLSKVGSVFKNIYETKTKNVLDKFVKEMKKQGEKVNYEKITKKVFPNPLDELKFEQMPSKVPIKIGDDATAPAMVVPTLDILNIDTVGKPQKRDLEVSGYYLDLSRIKNRKDKKFVEPMKKGGEVRSSSNKNYRDFLNRLGRPEMQYPDLKPLQQRAKGGGINTLNELARTMNYR